MKKISISLILIVLIVNFFSISHDLYLNFTQFQFDLFSTLLYISLLSFISLLIFFILTKNIKTPIYLSFYFILCLITTIVEIVYLSSYKVGTKINMVYFLIYFSLFIYVTKSINIRKYFTDQ